MNVDIKNLAQEINEKVREDTVTINDVLATFIDRQIIDRKFATGFPGHQITDRYRKKKAKLGQPEKVGTATGELRRAATQFVEWENRGTATGIQRIIKKRYGLTWYSHMVKTIVGGELDYLGLTDEDKVLLEQELKRQFEKNNMTWQGGMRVIKKNVSEEK